MKKQAKTSSERKKSYRARQESLGRIRREYGATVKEHEIIKDKLKELRNNEMTETIIRNTRKSHQTVLSLIRSLVVMGFL